MDALAAEGLMFTQAHSSNGVCTPSRYALLTGKYNWRTFNDISWGFAAPDIPSSDTTLAEFLKTQGYDTAAFGKWHLGGFFYNRAGVPYRTRDNPDITDPALVDWEHPLVGHATDNGFDVFRGLAVTINLPPYVYVKDDRIQYYDAASAYRDARNTDAFHSFTLAELARRASAATSSRPRRPVLQAIDADPIMLGEVENYLGERAADPAPFFAYVAMYSPHEPWHVTPPFQGGVGFPYGDWMAEFDSRVGRFSPRSTTTACARARW